jgi:trk system potassium uptake protein TrkH
MAGAGLFPAVAYTLASVSTGGFAPHDLSLSALDGWIPQAAVILLSTAGAVALPLYYRAWRRGARVLLADPELRTLLACGLAVTVLLAVDMAARDGWTAAAHDAPLVGFSAQTTTGFTCVDVGALDGFAKVVVIVAMLLGGCVGSTAGGLKIFRVLLIGRLAAWVLRRVRMPDRAVSEPRLGGEPIEPATIRHAAVVVGLFLVALVASWLPFLAYGHDPLDSLFEVASALGTVGLSTGVAAPDLEGVLKGVLCLDMLLGRLEIVAIVVLLTPATWIGRRTST